MMFGQMDRYIARTVFLSIVVVGVCAIALTGIFTLIDELQSREPGYTFVDALWYVLFTLPTQVYEVLPFVVFIGSLIGLGILSSQSELTVLRSSGVSLGRLFGAVCIPAVFVLLVGQLLSEYIAPRGEEVAARLKIQEQQESESVRLYSRYWYREGRLFTSIDGIDGDSRLAGVWQFELDEALHMVATRYAKRAIFDEDEKSWRLEDVVETVFADGATRTNSLDVFVWRTLAEPRLLGASVLVEPNKLSLGDLVFQINYMKREGLNPERYQIAFWMKVLQPASILGLVLIAVGFIVGPLREVGMGARLAVGFTVGIVFKYAQDLLAPMSLVWHFPAWIAVTVPIIAAWLLGLHLVRRAG